MSYLLHPDEPCLLRDLKDAGYHVWWGGKNDAVAGADAIRACCTERHQAEVNHPNLHFDQYWRKKNPDGTPGYSFFAGQLEKHSGEKVYLDSDWSHILSARDFILNRQTDKPFCLYLCLEYPHPPYGVEKPYFSAIDRTRLPRRRPYGTGKPRLQELIRERQALGERTDEQWDELRAAYYGQCARVDAQLGMIIDALKQAGQYDGTALFFFSDHGDYTGDYGIEEKAQNLFEDCLTRVPLIIKPPANTPLTPGTRDALVELIDIAPTVYQMAGITPGHDHFGKPLQPLFVKKHAEHRDAVFCEGGIRPGDWLETSGDSPQNLYWPRVSLSRDDPSAYGRAIMCRTQARKYVLRIQEPCELYDLEKDPDELHNVEQNPEYAQDVAALRERLLRFLWETADVAPRTPDPRDTP